MQCINMKNSQIAKFFTVSESFISKIKLGKRDFTWQMSIRMASLFPEKTREEWRESSFDEWKERLGCLNNIST